MMFDLNLVETTSSRIYYFLYSLGGAIMINFIVLEHIVTWLVTVSCSY